MDLLALSADASSSLEALRFLGVKLINPEDFAKLLVRFSFNLLVTWGIVQAFYQKGSRKAEYVFTLILIGSTIFLLCYLLESVKLELGFALGLFAIFGIIRYRTDAIPIKEMTYLFVVIGVAVMNALSNKKVSYAELVFTNAAIVSLLFALERLWLSKHAFTHRITYEKIALIHRDREPELIIDLKERTGLDVERAEIESVDFVRDIAHLVVHYHPEPSGDRE